MILAVWGTAAAVVAGSLLLGYALELVGVGTRSARPAVGLAVLILISSLAIKLPGDARTAAVAILLACLVAGAILLRRRAPGGRPTVGVAVTVLAAAGASVPFLANGRVGLLGVSLDNDTANHLVYAEGLRSPVSRSLYGVPNGYPLGPHSLADALSTGLGARLDLALTGVLVATVALIALTGAQALRHESGWRRAVIGVTSGLFYLLAAYYAEGAFKEPILGLILLAGVLHLEEVGRLWSAHAQARWRLLVPLALLTAAAIYVYSYLALVFLVPTFVLWLAGELAVAPRVISRWRREIVTSAAPAGVALAVLVVLLLPEAGRILSLVGALGASPSGGGAIVTSNLGNLAHELSPFQALGIWPNPDFRFFPVNVFHAGELSTFAFAVVAGGMVWSVGRREFAFPAAVITCALVWLDSSHGQSPYVTAKALVIAEPVIAVTACRGLLATPHQAWQRRWLIGRLASAAVFLGLVAYSSCRALADEPVWTSESTDELLSLDQTTRGHTVLVLAATDYAEWIFHDSRMSAIAPESVSLEQAVPRATKPNQLGSALDFDSVNPQDLPRFTYVITTNTPYNSQPPAGFRLVRSLALYQLWERVGPLAPHQTIEPTGAPGATLNCASPQGRAISRSHGRAAIMSPPVIASVGGLTPGRSASVNLPLTAGRWELSLQYTSAVGVTVDAGTRHWSMPAYVDRPGPVFSVGAISVSGALPVRLTTDKPLPVSGPGLAASISAVIATRLPDVRRIVMLRRACGQYVDWYRTTP